MAMRSISGGVAREPVGSFSSYEDAQQAVDHLADRGFPVSRVSIVGEGIRYVERVTGTWSYGHAAVHGMITGASIAALVGFVLGAASVVDPLVSGLALAVYGLVLGGALGVTLGLLAHAVWRGRRDFRSNDGLEAAYYELHADLEVVDEAKRILQQGRVRALQ